MARSGRTGPRHDRERARPDRLAIGGIVGGAIGVLVPVVVIVFFPCGPWQPALACVLGVAAPAGLVGLVLGRRARRLRPGGGDNFLLAGVILPWAALLASLAFLILLGFGALLASLPPT